MNNAKLTTKEEEVMNLFWKHGDLFIRELQKLYDEPRPHFNTLSTTVRALEERGYISHRSFGNSYQYFASITKDKFNTLSLNNIIGKYYNDSAYNAVSSLVEEDKISLKELKELIDLVEKRK